MKLNSMKYICPEAWRHHEKSPEWHIKNQGSSLNSWDWACDLSMSSFNPCGGSESITSTLPSLKVSVVIKEGRDSGGLLTHYLGQNKLASDSLVKVPGDWRKETDYF